ncbi:MULTISPECIES: NrtA/SsuA/CpmA family ABC transporter substrate-binding protein [unclassified Afipia]|uniref:ABC transporter substrate-binding protein n=1 Tax=unclassified Afipia TaxID=2642050 RepID=UPI000464CD85|nr:MULTISPECIES: NrtA/SsuA/CpmA family ABC transporter substrate-binding protein [unclassified Afipia]
MTENRRSFLRGVIGAFAAASVFSPASARERKTIRIGWQPSQPVSAQIAHTLAKTNILEKNDLKGELLMFSYGPAVNEALVSGAIDVGFVGDMPSVSLAAAGAPTTVVARQSTFRGSIIVPPNSSIQTIQDLKGKKLYGPTGSSIHLAALNMLGEAGLRRGSDVEILNMSFAELTDALKANRIEALFVWDPWIENFVRQGLARVVASKTDLTMVIAARDDFRSKNPDAVERFLKAHKEALLFAARNHEKTNAWFREPAAAQALDPATVEQAASYDPQWNAKKQQDIRLSFNAAEKDRYLGLGRQAFELKIFPSAPPLERKIDMSAAERLDASSWEFDPASVLVKQ